MLCTLKSLGQILLLLAMIVCLPLLAKSKNSDSVFDKLLLDFLVEFGARNVETGTLIDFEKPRFEILVDHHVKA